jgi:hypothetical protein
MARPPLPKSPYGGKEGHEILIHTAARFRIVQPLEEKDIAATDVAIKPYAGLGITEAKIDSRQEKGLFGVTTQGKRFFVTLED